MRKEDLEHIRKLVGNISEEQLGHTDYAFTKNIGLFMPIIRPCGYAVTPDHTHPTYSFVFAFDNYARIGIDGRIITSCEGTFCAISGDVPHEEIVQYTVPRYIAVMVDTAFFESVWHTIQATPPPIFRGDVFPFTERLASALKEFLREFECRSPGFETLLAGEEAKICLLIARQILGNETPAGRLTYLLSVNRAVELVNRRFAEKISVGEMAAAAHLSISRFTKVFKEETGATPTEFIMNVRLDRARRMLIHDAASLTEVALAAGFGSSSYFSYCFTKHFNMSPSDFRKSIGQ